MAYITVLKRNKRRDELTSERLLNWFDASITNDKFCGDLGVPEEDHEAIRRWLPEVLYKLMNNGYVTSEGDVGLYMLACNLVEQYLKINFTEKSFLDNEEICGSDHMLVLVD